VFGGFIGEPGGTGRPGNSETQEVTPIVATTVRRPLRFDAIDQVLADADALADAEACAAIVVHAAGRHGAQTIAQLAELAAIRVRRLEAPVAAAA